MQKALIENVKKAFWTAVVLYGLEINTLFIYRYNHNRFMLHPRDNFWPFRLQQGRLTFYYRTCVYLKSFKVLDRKLQWGSCTGGLFTEICFCFKMHRNHFCHISFHSVTINQINQIELKLNLLKISFFKKVNCKNILKPF